MVFLLLLRLLFGPALGEFASQAGFADLEADPPRARPSVPPRGSFLDLVA